MSGDAREESVWVEMDMGTGDEVGKLGGRGKRGGGWREKGTYYRPIYRNRRRRRKRSNRSRNRRRRRRIAI